FSCTFDGWTGNKTSYWSCVCHAIKPDFTMAVFELGLIPIFAPVHDADVVTSHIKERLRRLSIPDSKLVASVTDAGGASPKIASFLIPGGVAEQHCFSHIINLILSHAHAKVVRLYPAIGAAMDICKDFASLYNSSTQFKEQLMTNKVHSEEPV